MVCKLRNLLYYLNACYDILHAKGVDNRIQTIDKTNKLLSAMCVEMPCLMVPWHIYVANSWKYYPHNFCSVRNFNGSNIPSFHHKPDDCNLTAAILVHKLFQLHKTLTLGRFWLEFLRLEWDWYSVKYILNPYLTLTHFRPMFHLWINQVVGFY